MPVSLLGHFSFIVFAGYLLVIFPLTFVVMSQRLLRFISAALATAGLTLLLVDSEVFSISTCTSIRWCGIWWSTRTKASFHATGS